MNTTLANYGLFQTNIVMVRNVPFGKVVHRFLLQDERRWEMVVNSLKEGHGHRGAPTACDGV